MKFLLPSALLVAMFALGCVHEEVTLGARHPAVAISVNGDVSFRGERIPLDQLPRALRRAGVETTDEIAIHVPDDLSDPNILRRVMGTLARAGYTRPICVTDRHAAAYQKDGKDPMQEYKRESSSYPPGEKVYGAGW